MPFPEHNKFKVVDVDSYTLLITVLDQLASEDGSKHFDYVILDSFTSLTEILEKWADANFNNYTVWREYNAAIMKVISRLKKLPQQVFVLGIPEYLDAEFGNSKQYLKVKGKELKATVEKEFSVVLFTSPMYNDDTGEMDDVEMVFKPNRNNSAKSPTGLFEVKPKNDYLAIANAVKTFYKIQE